MLPVSSATNNKPEAAGQFHSQKEKGVQAHALQAEEAADGGAADGGSTSLVVAVLSASAENSLGSVSNSVLFVFGNNTVGHLLNQKRVGPVMDGGK